MPTSSSGPPDEGGARKPSTTSTVSSTVQVHTLYSSVPPSATRAANPVTASCGRAAAVQPFARVVVGTGIGNPAIIFALTLAAAFGISRIVEQNLLTVQPGVIEAARSVGAGPLRIIFTLLIPEALGPLILGYTFIFVALVDMSAVAGYVGGGGLGNFAIQYGYRLFNPVVTWAAVLIIIVLVQLVQWLGNTLARKALRR